jgi:hypothetical protein
MNFFSFFTWVVIFSIAIGLVAAVGGVIGHAAGNSTVGIWLGGSVGLSLVGGYFAILVQTKM